MKFLLLYLLALPAHTTTFEGYTALRHLIQNIDDGLNTQNAQGKNSSRLTRKQYQIRAGLRAKGEIEPAKNLTWAIGFRTTSSANSDWVTWQNASDRTIALETAMFKYVFPVQGNLNLQLGRAPTVFLHDGHSQLLWDRDTRWDGLSLQWERDNLGFALSHYLLGARNAGSFGASTFRRTEASESDANSQSGFGALSGAQAIYHWKSEKEWKGTIAFGRYHYTGTQGGSSSGAYQNSIHGGSAGTVGNVNPLIMDNARQWHLYSDLSWRLWRFVAEFVQNRKVFYGTRSALTGREAQREALALSLMYGSTKEVYGWQLSYSYVRKGLGSVISAFSHSSMPADNLGHLLDARFALAKNFNLGTKVEFYEELGKKGGDGLPSSPSTRNQKSSNVEFNAGVSF